jgi:hypothetical protein
MRRSSSLKSHLARVMAVVASVLLHSQIQIGIAQSARTNPDAIVFVPPTRRAPEAPPAQPPELPSAGEHVTPLTLELVTRHQPGKAATNRVRQTVSRTRNRIHIAFGDGREWLFERNLIDPRRVSGWLIIHGSRTIVLHDESELRNRLEVKGWADVLMLGLDPSVLRQLKPTGQARTINGIRFVKQAPLDENARVSDVWWSEEHALPSAFVISHGTGSTRISVTRLRAGVTADLLTSPTSRFPAYRMVDLAEWLEGH